MPAFSDMYRSDSLEAVSIVEPDGISPIMLADSKSIADDFSLDRSAPRQHRAKMASKLRGRPSVDPSKSPFLSSHSPWLGGQQNLVASPNLQAQDQQSEGKRLHRPSSSGTELHAKISQWLEAEKTRRRSRPDKSPFRPSDILAKLTKREPRDRNKEDGTGKDDQSRRSSDAAIDDLAQILEEFSTSRRGSLKSLSRRSSLLKLRRMSTGASSDTDYFDGERFAPDCDGWLDNSKTLAYAGGTSETPSASPNLARKAKEQQAWSKFKYEIVRLTHTLRIKGWRRVSMERTNEISVERLSGAMTNAVYVVIPPKDVPPKAPGSPSSTRDRTDLNAEQQKAAASSQSRGPLKLLLRIYGPQVEHLIDREAELSILRRLCRKNIGPNLLGTFANGRFEQFLHATTLTAEAVREPETSKQIAKRMRELHDGIDLLYEERNAGPWVWQNWDKWEERCGMVVDHLDRERESEQNARARRGSKVGKEHICWTEWNVFVTVVKRYRKWLYEQYGGTSRVNNELVFAHNDTQYGNILRLLPPSNSPLLRPVNQHKTLSVIDFEYAGANTRGLEFANHFTEWAYNYHDAVSPHTCNTARYPTAEEQLRFVKAYVYHKPSQSRPTTPALEATTPNAGPVMSSSSISAFMLDARTPGGSTASISAASATGPDLEKVARDEEDAKDAEVQHLLKETRLWRLANSAHWMAWGIVQAKIEGLQVPGDKDQQTSHDDAEEVDNLADNKPMTDPLGPDEQSMERDLEGKRPDGMMRPEELERRNHEGNTSGNADEEEDGFDYLAFAHDRALFFWGDAVLMGMVKEEELPAGLVARLKKVDY